MTDPDPAGALASSQLQQEEEDPNADQARGDRRGEPAGCGTASQHEPVVVAERIAREAHAGQKDRVDGTDYITHIERVVALVDGDDAKAVAWLHDVLEDCPTWTGGALNKAGIPGSLVEAVIVLTRRAQQPYEDYIRDLHLSGNPLALAVKLADLRDHLRPNCPARLRPRYEQAFARLTAQAIERAQATNAVDPQDRIVEGRQRATESSSDPDLGAALGRLPLEQDALKAELDTFKTKAARCQQKADLLLDPLRARSRELGYALAVHGSLMRDIDLIAAPWTDDAVSADELAQALIRTIEDVNGVAMIGNDPKAAPLDYTRRSPQPMPHSRIGWSIHLGGGPYIDLSILPRVGPTADWLTLKLAEAQRQREQLEDSLLREAAKVKDAEADVARLRHLAHQLEELVERLAEVDHCECLHDTDDCCAKVGVACANCGLAALTEGDDQ